jgi:hypothetical protein
MSEVKVVITAIAMTSTLALWSVFSKQARLEALAAESQEQIALTVEAPVAAIELSPLPTLIPPLPENAFTSVQVQPLTAQTTIAQPIVPSGKIILGGSKPGTQQQQQARDRKPAARTRSSN